MSRQTLAVIVGAVVLFIATVAGAMAFTGGDSDSGGGVHTMPGGSTMSDTEMEEMETTAP